jgi:hypothetical protein
VSAILGAKINGIERHIATSSALIYIEGKVIQASVTSPIADFQWTREAAQSWLNHILEKNSNTYSSK